MRESVKNHVTFSYHKFPSANLPSPADKQEGTPSEPEIIQYKK